MVSPAPVDPPGQVADLAGEMQPKSPNRDSATRQFLDTFGFHLLVVLLGIALAFM